MISPTLIGPSSAGLGAQGDSRISKLPGEMELEWKEGEGSGQRVN